MPQKKGLGSTVAGQPERRKGLECKENEGNSEVLSSRDTWELKLELAILEKFADRSQFRATF